MILTVGSTKGGVGKTMLAVNLTVALAQSGQDVLLIDGDEQSHAFFFTELRKSNRADLGPGYTAVASLGQEIRDLVRDQIEAFDQIVIDVGGRDTGSMRNALLVSDLILVPTAPRAVDLWGAEATGELVVEARAYNPELRGLAVINAADASGSHNNDARSALRKIMGLEVAKARIGRRKAYPNAFQEGLGILEYRDHSNAVSVSRAQFEFTGLFKVLFPKLKLERKIA